MRLVFATRNAHKAREVRALLAHTDIELVDLSPWPELGDLPEDHDSFEANALQKARIAHAHIGLPVVAEDSGIEVVALHGAPGVHSKRFSAEGTDAGNNALLLERLRGLTDRRARYRCVVALVTDHGEATAQGTCRGTIGLAPRGEGGFGYDPLFWPDEYPGRTMAELTMEEKNRISHRGRAFRQIPALAERLLALPSPT